MATHAAKSVAVICLSACLHEPREQERQKDQREQKKHHIPPSLHPLQMIPCVLDDKAQANEVSGCVVQRYLITHPFTDGLIISLLHPTGLKLYLDTFLVH